MSAYHQLEALEKAAEQVLNAYRQYDKAETHTEAKEIHEVLAHAMDRLERVLGEEHL